MRIDDSAALDRLDFARGGGLIAVIAQHAHTGEVLMLAYANRDALERTLAERVMWYFSRSRDQLWRKGDTSGNVQSVVSLHGDCDGDDCDDDRDCLLRPLAARSADSGSMPRWVVA